MARICKSIELAPAVLALSSELPMLGRRRLALEMQQRGIRISPSTIRKIWLKHGLETPSKRVSASEMFATDGRALPSTDILPLYPQVEPIETSARGYSDSFAFTLMAVAVISSEAAHAESHSIQVDEHIADAADHAIINACVLHEDAGGSLLEHAPPPLTMDFFI